MLPIWGGTLPTPDSFIPYKLEHFRDVSVQFGFASIAHLAVIQIKDH
jgi:hypothetical protein